MNKQELIESIQFHLKMYEDETIDGDDLANAVEQLINEQNG
jgi:predicted small metal-binding protein